MPKCKKSGHEIRRNDFLGSLVRPNIVWHYIDGWGSKICPECNCQNPEIDEFDLLIMKLAKKRSWDEEV